jgi:hypothetical protein
MISGRCAYRQTPAVEKTLPRGLFEGEWFPNVPAEKKRTAAIGMCVYLLVGGCGTIVLLWLTDSF